MPPTFDPAWLDAQYNNRARIPEHPQIFARWAEDSRRARQALSPALDVRYGPAAEETLDVFAAVGPRAPVLVFIHGGWWRALDKADHSFLAPAFVQAGVTLVVPNYTLCPAATIEDITLQMVRAVAWTVREIAAYGGDPRRIVVAGHSAGGHLAAMLACCRWQQAGADLPERAVQGALAISGLFDLEPVRQTPFLQADLRLTPDAVRKLSPAGFPAPQVPLAALVGGDESEEFLRQNELIREAWGARAVPVCEAVPGRHHLDVLDALGEPGSRLHAVALELLGER
ncbi:alpha/beta hydrolase [Schlegelella sp. S2-27]|uniref:Alpha/beta hydrolase n=1 Tax=Caldimonas mangrovi TaxID=2944811 RepID=A0ABT0YN74_9BURK|nr:alpha/beta hydrolase [Caldimonas mangrovi]MCM5680184.1 alpha/beta hydrolase [Caldimonas mangrovi]